MKTDLKINCETNFKMNNLGKLIVLSPAFVLMTILPVEVTTAQTIIAPKGQMV